MNLNELREAITKVLEYNWADEERDYNDRGGDCEENDQHIYKTLLELDRFINED